MSAERAEATPGPGSRRVSAPISTGRDGDTDGRPGRPPAPEGADRRRRGVRDTGAHGTGTGSGAGAGGRRPEEHPGLDGDGATGGAEAAEAAGADAAVRRPHGGKRRYGYTPDGMRVVPHEAAIVREVFARYLAGDSPTTIARDLTARGERTALDATWTGHTVLDLLGSRHVAGIRVRRGREVGDGAWPALVDRAVWQEIRERRRLRAAPAPSPEGPPRRFYLLRGLVVCRACDLRMGGSGGSYLCNRGRHADGTPCGRRISAASLEAHVEAVVVELLERPGAVPPVPAPATDVLTGLTGPDAARRWAALREAGDLPRLNAVLRHVVDAVLVDGAHGRGRRFDPGRVEIRPRPR